MIGSVTQEPSRHLLLPLKWTTSGSGKSVSRDKRTVLYPLPTGGKQKESLDNCALGAKDCAEDCALKREDVNTIINTKLL